MTKYRFKTKEEFIRDGLWDEKYNCPNYWASDGQMNKYLGEDVPDKHTVNCDGNKNFTYNGWLFQNTDYTLKEQQEYFDDLSQHIGRYIRALVDNPHAGIGVKQGDIGKIINEDQADFPNNKEYFCTEALREENLGIRYELLPEDYSPEQEDKESSVKFIPGKWYKYNKWYIKYKEHIDGVWRSSEEIDSYKKYRIKESKFGDRDSDDKKILLIDLSEIQEYLPEGHPDKVIKQKFEIGRWYKWYQKNHESYHYGKVKEINLETDTLVVIPWIIQCDEYIGSGTFALSEAKQIQEISVEEVQEFLPKDHSDKISSDIFKKGEYIVIILKVESFSKDFISNYIYKQREDYKHLRPELDNYSSKTNGWETIGKNNPHNWRYAIQEEINEYERRGKPYDVTELNKQSLPEENIIEVPEYIEAIDSYSDYFISGKIYKVKNSNNLTSAVLNCNDLVNFNEYNNLYVSLTSYRWKASTKEAYEQQKSLTYKSISGCDPYKIIIPDTFIHDEVGYYSVKPSECKEKIPKFEEQDFDIYGPTPDIE